MNQEHLTWKLRHGEHGQTIFLVVVSLVSLLGMAALAIDVVTLFVAHTEIQRAADAAALAGAKAIADSGYTTDALVTNTLAQSMANAGINSILQQNLVAGRAPQLVGSVGFNFTPRENPVVTVTLQQTNLPTFFARIWGRGLATVSANASAEAYNPSGQTTAIAPQCVKPWFFSNTRGVASNFVDPVSGAVNPAVHVGDSLNLLSACLGQPCLNLTFPRLLSQGQYLPVDVVPGGTKIVPACAAGGTDYAQSIAGCDSGTTYACGGTANINLLPIDPGLAGGVVEDGLKCLLTQDGVGPLNGQDTIDVSGVPTGPIQIQAGSRNPLVRLPGAVLAEGDRITTSSSIVTVPVIDTSAPLPIGLQVKVIGFIQGFVTDLTTVNVGGINVISVHMNILNVSGCPNAPPPGPVSGGGISPVPVRLIHQ